MAPTLVAAIAVLLLRCGAQGAALGRSCRLINHYRTMCLAPQPEFRRLLEEIYEMRLAA
jgi:hypothetical protein